MQRLEDHLGSLDPDCLYLEWFEGQLEESEKTPSLFLCKVLDYLRCLLRQIAYCDDLGYSQRPEFDPNCQRIHG